MAARPYCLPGVLPVLGDGEKAEQEPEESILAVGLSKMIRFLTGHVAWAAVDKYVRLIQPSSTRRFFVAQQGIDFVGSLRRWYRRDSAAVPGGGRSVNLAGTDFDIMDLTPDQSFLRDFYNKAAPAEYTYEYCNFEKEQLTRDILRRGLQLRGSPKKHRTGTTPSMPIEAFVAVDVNREGCAAALPSGVTTCATR
eukprot:Skav226941  [mRNA]  locus=scaffold965:312835:318446:- [translate_table: standard]